MHIIFYIVLKAVVFILSNERGVKYKDCSNRGLYFEDNRITYSWRLIKRKQISSIETVQLTQLLIYSEWRSGFKFVFVYSLFNDQTNSLSIYKTIVSQRIESGHDKIYDIDSSEIIINAPKLSFHLNKYTVIYEVINQWVIHQQNQSLQYIMNIELYSFDCFVTNEYDNLYVVYSRIRLKQKPTMFIIEEIEWNIFNIIKVHE